MDGLAPEVKLVATTAYVMAVVCTPPEAVPAFAVHAAVAIAALLLARIPARTLMRRLRIEIPFVAFAALLPVMGAAPRIDVGPLSLSQAGLWAMWGIVVKATLGLAASVVLIATTSPSQILEGCSRLRLPPTLVAIAGFMVRYGSIIGDEADRMAVARRARGDESRWFWQMRGAAAVGGALVVRSYERGERVHRAMLARGYDGTMPPAERARPNGREWGVALVLPFVSCVTALIAIVAP